MTRLCKCGHTRHAHQHWSHPTTECALCACPKWRPRRFWYPWRHAAAIIADAQQHSAPAPDPGQVPGQNPVPGQRSPDGVAESPRSAPAPDHDCGPVGKQIAIHLGGCMFAWDHRTRQWEQLYHCGRPPFNVAEWEERLRQS